jgi:F0F1-type ATP synthase gamma subunit
VQIDTHDPAPIERRMHAVQAVRQVTHALWALSSAQLPLVEEAVAQASEYLDWVDAMVEHLAGRPVPGPTHGTLHVVIGPERGYSGSLGRDVLGAIPSQGALGLVGRRLIELASESHSTAARLRFALPAATTPDEPESIAEAVAEAVLQRADDTHVVLHHPRAGQRGLSRSVILAGAREARPAPPDSYSPLATVLGAAVRESVRGRLTIGVAEALRAEVVARIAATERARKACDQRVEELEQLWRVAQRERTTTEVLELSAIRSREGTEKT